MLRCLALSWVCFGCTAALAGPRVEAFCAAWTQAASTATDADEAMQKTLAALRIDNPPAFTWESALVAVSHASPATRLQILKGAAKDAGEEFTCPAFEFPGGPPRHKVELAGVTGGVAFAADDDGFVVLQERSAPAGARKLVLRAATKILSEALTESGPLLLSPRAVVVIAKDDVVVVPRGGGKPVVLMKREGAGGFVIEKNDLLFVADSRLQSISLSGGAPRTLATLESAGDSKDATIHRLGAAHVVATGGGSFCVTGNEVTTLQRISGESFVIGNELFTRVGPSGPPRKKLFGGSSGRAPALEPGLYRLSCAAEPVRVGDAVELSFVVARDGAAYGVSRLAWYGKQQLQRFKPGEAEAKVLAEPLGEVVGLSITRKRIFWLDAWFGAVYSVPIGG